MKILALELSTARGSIAWLDEVDLVMREWTNDRKNSGPFFVNLQNMREKFGPPEEIVVGLGPGSYAGVRIAISAAIGLQVTSKTRLIGYPSICAMECEADEYGVIGDARRQSFFFARIRARGLIEGPTLFTESELQVTRDKLGDNMPIFSSDNLTPFKGIELRYPSALVLAGLTRSASHSFSLPPLEPIYLREPHITVPKTATTAS
jgi:tRNA threonylcarbamoyladenosine biosynthesis protein TsaB